MNELQKLQKIISKCKCSVNLTINCHKDYHQTVQEYLNDQMELSGNDLEIENDIETKMNEIDTIIELQFYPDTPIGFYRIFHYNLEQALNEALEILNLK